MNEGPSLLIASNNKHKHAEISQILTIEGRKISLITPADIGISLEPIENALTYLGNAQIKARAFHAALKAMPGSVDWVHTTFVLADDSGIEVDALGGRPGLLSARYATGAPLQDGCAAILKELLGVAPHDRTARFRAAIVAIAPSGAGFASEGVVEGEIATEKRGANGFGYDPIFRPVGSNLHLAEFETAEKHRISHRGIAIRNLLPSLFESINKVKFTHEHQTN